MATQRATARPGGSHSRLARSNRRFGAILAAPALLVVLGLIAWPAVQTFLYSIQDASFTRAGSWVGIDNYVRLFGDERFQHAFILTVVYAVSFLVLSTGLGLLFALLLNQEFHGRWLARSLLIVPWAFPWIMVGIIWKWFIDGDVGLLRALVVDTGMSDSFTGPLATQNGAFIATVLAAVWRQASLAALLFLAGLQTMPRELHEAAMVDGASTWQRFTQMTLPWLRPVMAVVVILNTIFGFMQFDVIWAMTEGGPGDATTMLSIFLYRQLFVNTDLPLASTTSVVLGLVALGLGYMFVKMMYRSSKVGEAVQ